MGRAKGAHLVGHYLDTNRRPPRVTQWSVKHREEQTRICEKYVLPVIAEVACRELTGADFQEIIDLASTPSVAHHIRRTLTALMGAGVEEGYAMVGRDLLRCIRWLGETTVEREPADPAVAEDEIPTVAAVHELAAARHRAMERARSRGCGRGGSPGGLPALTWTQVWGGRCGRV